MYSIDVLDYKPSHETPRRLAELEEQRHILLGVRGEDGQCIAVFPNGDFALPLDLREELAGMVGRTVAVLR
ncbi:MAG: hypothetical protein WA141_01105, partial [Methanothrix sp.]